MAQKIKGITIEIGGNVQPLNKALEGVNKSRDLQSELKQVDRLLKLDPKNTELLAQKQKLLGEAVSNTKTKLDTLKEAQKQVEEQFRRGEVGAEQYRAIQREVIKAEQDLKSLEKQLKEVNNKWKSAGKAVQDFGSKATKVGKSLTKNVTAPILGAAAASQVAWKEVDDALDTVITKTGATGEALEGLEQSFKGVAKTLPADLQTVGDAIGEINTQFGLTGRRLKMPRHRQLSSRQSTVKTYQKLPSMPAGQSRLFNLRPKIWAWSLTLSPRQHRIPGRAQRCFLTGSPKAPHSSKISTSILPKALPSWAAWSRPGWIAVRP